VALLAYEDGVCKPDVLQWLEILAPRLSSRLGDLDKRYVLWSNPCTKYFTRLFRGVDLDGISCETALKLPECELLLC